MIEKHNPLGALARRYQLILMSGSPRRRELIAMLDLPFVVDTSHNVDETCPDDLPAEEVPVYLSRLKASAVTLEADDPRLLVTADTIVVLDGKILGKPKDDAEARSMLAEMSGREQTVVTGVTIKTASDRYTFSEKTKVKFATLTTEEIDYYVSKYHPLDKAGAYGIQEWIGAAAIEGIDGSFYNVMGLPIHRLYTALHRFLPNPTE
ncbi:MAG: Maf family nucleotide pyrophosphatase [Lachnoclostridium sp.]|nr:Maf family nucleotide pyrophosphatase [Lachnoclostridium sp.]